MLPLCKTIRLSRQEKCRSYRKACNQHRFKVVCSKGGKGKFQKIWWGSSHNWLLGDLLFQHLGDLFLGNFIAKKQHRFKVAAGRAGFCLQGDPARKNRPAVPNEASQGSSRENSDPEMSPKRPKNNPKTTLCDLRKHYKTTPKRPQNDLKTTSKRPQTSF